MMLQLKLRSYVSLMEYFSQSKSLAKLYVAYFHVATISESSTAWRNLLPLYVWIEACQEDTYQTCHSSFWLLECTAQRTACPRQMGKIWPWATSEETAYPIPLCVAIATALLDEFKTHGCIMPPQSLSDINLTDLPQHRAGVGVQSRGKRLPPLVSNYKMLLNLLGLGHCWIWILLILTLFSLQMCRANLRWQPFLLAVVFSVLYPLWGMAST